MPVVVPSQVKRLIEQLLPWIREAATPNLGIRQSPQVEAVVGACAQIPHQLVLLNDADYADYLASIYVLKSHLRICEVRGERHSYSADPLRTVYRLLGTCPDEAPAPATQTLAFIADDALRSSLRSDISSANSAFANLEWKAATVLAGSVVEALLLWKLDTDFTSAERTRAVTALVEARLLARSPNPALEKWDLHEYVEVAAQLGAVTNETAAQARLAREFRNLIHPGRAVRLGQSCSRATALAALAAMELVVRDLIP